MMACSCEKRGNNVSNVRGKTMRAWQNTNNDIAKCKAGITGTEKENDTTLQMLSSNGLRKHWNERSVRR